MDSSDEEQPITQTTTISLNKPKKERTEAQKQATARALEALAKAREAKKIAKQKEATTTIRKTTTTKVVMPKAKASKPVEEKVIEEQEEPPAPFFNKAEKKWKEVRDTAPPDMMSLFFNEMSSLRNEIKSLSAKPEKPKKKKVIIEESSSESEEEAVVVRRKKKNSNGTAVRIPTDAKNQVIPRETDSNALLQSIFFRNH